MDTLTKIKPFSKSWWQDFVSNNQNFSETTVTKGAIEGKLLEALNEGVLEVLRERFRLEHVGTGFRVYLDSIEQNDKYLLDLCKSPPSEVETITEYSERIFDKKFGIIINSGEKHSDLLSENVIGAMQPILETVGIPVSGLEITIFIGNYGWTPLGIHQDHEGENVIHFHLGPGEKTMYTWDEKKYEELTKEGTKYNNMDVEPLLKYAKEYPFEMGDIYSMPWNKFHIGHSGELSVGVTVWFNNPPKEKFAQKVLDAFAYQYLDEEAKDIIPPEQNYLNSTESFNDLMSSMQLPEEVLNYTTKEFFQLIYNDFKYCIASNGGWQSLPLPMKLKEDYDVNNFEFLAGKKIQSKRNFKIHYYHKDDVLYMFVRGTKIQMRYHEELTSIIDKINTHDEYMVEHLLENLSKEWPTEAGLYVLSELYNNRGIYIV